MVETMDSPPPILSKRDLNRQRRLQQLQVAALPLFLRAGIEAVTIDEIVQAAGVAKGSFYRYFKDKEALVAATIAPIRAHTSQAFDRCEVALLAAPDTPALLAAYEALAMTLAPALIESRDVVQLYLQESRCPGRANGPVRAFADELSQRAVVLTAAADTHNLLRKLPPALSALAVIGAAERLAYDHLCGKNVPDPAEAAHVLMSIVVDGITGSAAG